MDLKLVIAGSILILILVGGALLYMRMGEEGKVLKILNYSEYIDPDVLKMFENETGIKIVYDEYEAAEEAWPKLKAGGSGYDLIIIAHTHVKLAIEAGVVQKLDKSKIPNLANLDEVVASHPADPNQDYAVPYMWGTTGIAYVSTCVEDPPRTWKELLDPGYLEQYKGRVSLLSEFTDVVEASMIALGIDPTNPDNWNNETAEKVVDLLSKVKPYLVGFYGASQYMPALANEEVCLAQAWNGDVLVVQEENENVGYVNPEDGTIYWVDFMLIPRDAENVEAAYKFINFLLRPDIAARNVKMVWYAASIKKQLLIDYAEEHGDKELMEILEDPAVYPPGDVKLVPSPVLDKRMSEVVEWIRLHVLQPGG
ncbi:MAG: spermidine/putrescine ABC transporter substrate-binding protein [Desulfurococcales archaeon]|nr:spermidine/putrescine ABC transporter substrate-binding protein [Desulfurococcales archaeon]